MKPLSEGIPKIRLRRQRSLTVKKRGFVFLYDVRNTKLNLTYFFTRNFKIRESPITKKMPNATMLFLILPVSCSIKP